MKKAKLLSILMPLFALGALSGCKPKEEGPAYSYDKTYHWVEGAEADKARHDYEDEPEKTVQPTCTEKGKTFELCKVCGYEKETPQNMLDHELIEDTEKSVPSTCSVAGKKVEKCKNCTFSKSTDLEKAGHAFGTGVEKTEGGKTFLEFECSTCHQKGNNLVAFNSIEVDGDTATSGKLPNTAGTFGSWKVCLPAGEYQVFFNAKFGDNGENRSFGDSRGIEVKYNDSMVEFDGTKTAEDHGLTKTAFTRFSFFNIVATGGVDTLEIQNPYYRIVFDINSDIEFIPVVK